MNIIDNHREGLKWAYELLEMTMADVTPEQAHWTPPGIANPLGAVYAHAVCELDAIIHVLLQGIEPIFASTWIARTGISEPQWQANFDWARNLKIDLAAAREYAQAVYGDADAYIASLTESDLERKVDLSAQGLGIPTVNWCLNALVISHINNMAGEISVLKGLQGTRGYPF